MQDFNYIFLKYHILVLFEEIATWPVMLERTRRTVPEKTVLHEAISA